MQGLDAPAIAALFALALVLILAFFLFFFFKLLPENAFWTNYADTLMLESAARDFWDGASLLDWKLTQAPYLFPDLLLAILLAPLTAIGATAIAIQFVFLLLGVTGWAVLARRIGLTGFRALIGPLVFATFFLSSYSGVLLRSFPALMTGLPGHHSAVGVMLPWALLAVAYVMHVFDAEKDLDAWATVKFAIAVLLLFVLAISDETFVFCLLAPLCLILVLVNARSAKDLLRNFRPLCAALLLGLIILMEEFFHTLLPFSGKKDFVDKTLDILQHDFPRRAINCLLAILHLPFESPFTAAIVGLTIASAIFLFWMLRPVRLLTGPSTSVRIEIGAHERAIVAALLVGTIGLVLLQITFADFIPSESRRWMGAFVTLIVLASVFLANSRRPLATAIPSIVAIVLLSYQIATLRFIPHTPFVPTYRALAQCVQQNFGSEQSFVGNFWDVIPLALYTRNRPSGLVIGDADKNVIEEHGQNIVRLRTTHPQLALIRLDSTDPADFRRLFGEPERVVECSATRQIWDYSTNSKFRSHY